MDDTPGDPGESAYPFDEVSKRAPVGNGSAHRLIDAVTGLPDRFVERTELELKEVPKWDKRVFSKIAKFILGAGNRLEISQYFEGHAVLILGIDSGGQVTGVPPIDRHQFADGVERGLPSPHPYWDFTLIPHESSGKDLVVVFVPPPSPDAPVFISHVESDDLKNGIVYIRSRSETRPASGDEVRALIDRERSQPQPSAVISPLQPIVVQGPAAALGVALKSLMHADLVSRIPTRAVDPSNPLAAFSKSFNTAFDSWRQPPLSQESLDAWGAAFDQHWDAQGQAWLGLLLPSSDLRIKNTSDRWLEEVEVRITIDGPVGSTEKRRGTQEWGSLRRSIPRLVPKSPYDVLLPNLYAPPHPERAVALKTDRGLEIHFHLDRFRPRESKRVRADFVLYALGDCGAAIDAPWTMTARGFDAQFQGQTHFPLSGAIDIAVAAPAIYRNEPERIPPPLEAPN